MHIAVIGLTLLASLVTLAFFIFAIRQKDDLGD